MRLEVESSCCATTPHHVQLALNCVCVILVCLDLQTFAKNIARHQRNRVLLSRRLKAEASRKDSILKLTHLLAEAARIGLLQAGSSETMIADVLRTIQLEVEYKNDEEEENESAVYRTQQHNTQTHSLGEAISVRHQSFAVSAPYLPSKTSTYCS